MVTLMGAGLSCLISVLQDADFSVFFRRFVISVVVFAAIGIAVRLFLDFGFKVDKEEEEKKEEDSDENSQEQNDSEEDNDDSGESSEGSGTENKQDNDSGTEGS